MMGLHNVGGGLELAFGWWRVGLLYCVSGLYGGIASAVFVPTSLGVGASGAIFGLMGGSVSDFIQNYENQTKPIWTAFTLFMSVAINLGIGLLPLLNNFAHVGGFVCGALMGLLLFIEKADRGGLERDFHGYQFCLMMFACVSLFLLLCIGLYMLFSDVDPYGWCSWCKHLSCIETPWWSCDPVNTCGFQYNSSHVTYTCPAGSPGADGGLGPVSHSSLSVPKCFVAKDVGRNMLESCFGSTGDPNNQDQACIVMLCESCCFS
jgi:hypothetical protein